MPRTVSPVVAQTLNGLIDMQELCELLRVTSRSVQRWIHQRKLPPPIRRLSRRRLFWRRATVEKFLSDLELEAEREAARP